PAARTRMTEAVFADMMRKPDQGFDKMAPENISPLVAWLASTQSNGVTGRVFEVSGGKISVADGWREGPTVDRTERWDPAGLDAGGRGLLDVAAPPGKVYGSYRCNVVTRVTENGLRAESTGMMKRYGRLGLLGVLALSLPACGDGHHLTAVLIQRAAWDAQHIIDYSYDYRQSGFFSPITGGLVHVEVRGGSVRSAVFADTAEGVPGPIDFFSIDALFDSAVSHAEAGN